jgi:hypothetical protein
MMNAKEIVTSDVRKVETSAALRGYVVRKYQKNAHCGILPEVTMHWHP